MDFNNISTWQLVVRLEKIAGFWPFQRKITNAVICSLLLMILSSYAIPMCIRLLREWNKNASIVVENLVTIMMLFSTSIKILAAFCFQTRRKKIYSRIIEHLKKLQEEEFELMIDCIKNGLKFTLSYLAAGAVALVIFDGPSVFKMIVGFINGNSTDKPLPYYVEYGIDHNKYYNYIVFHTMMTECCATLGIFAYDLSFVTLVQHNCALLQVVTLRLKKALKVATSSYRNTRGAYGQNEDEARRLLITVVDIHNEALELIDFIDDAYNLCWFLKLIETVITTGALLSIVMAIRTDVLDFFRYLSYLTFALVAFHVPFNRGQLIVDHSSAIFVACCDCELEMLSKESVFLIRMIMTRSLNPSMLTGGKIFALTNESYGNMLKTALSYCAVFNTFVTGKPST